MNYFITSQNKFINKLENNKVNLKNYKEEFNNILLNNPNNKIDLNIKNTTSFLNFNK